MKVTVFKLSDKSVFAEYGKPSKLYVNETGYLHIIQPPETGEDTYSLQYFTFEVNFDEKE